MTESQLGSISNRVLKVSVVANHVAKVARRAASLIEY